MKTSSPAAVLVFLLALSAYAPTQRRTVTKSRPVASGTGYEAEQARNERDRENAAIAAEATQKRIDVLQKEVDELKRNASSQSAQASATTYLDQLRKNRDEQERKPLQVTTSQPAAPGPIRTPKPSTPRWRESSAWNTANFHRPRSCVGTAPESYRSRSRTTPPTP